MRVLPPGLQAYLDSTNVYTMTEVVQVTLVSGTVYRWTTATEDIVVGGQTYSAGGPIVSRSKIRWSSSVATDAVQVNLDGAVSLGGRRISLMAANGEFDGAQVVISTVYSSIGAWSSPNLLTTSNDFVTGWATDFPGNQSATNGAAVGPDGVAGSAARIDVTALSSDYYKFAASLAGLVPGANQVTSLWMRSTGGMTLTFTSQYHNATSGWHVATTPTITLTSTWTRYPSPAVAIVDAPDSAVIALAPTQVGSFEVAFAQLEAGSVATPYAPCTGEALFKLDLFVGGVEVAKPSSTTVGLKVSTMQAFLASRQASPAVVQKSCSWQLYSPGCGAVKAAHSVARTVTAATVTTLTHNQLDMTNAPGWIEMTSGASAGQARPIASTTGTVITLGSPFPYIPNVGDTFNIVNGCDKQLATCYTTFANVQRNRACPFVPRPAVVANTLKPEPTPLPPASSGAISIDYSSPVSL